MGKINLKLKPFLDGKGITRYQLSKMMKVRYDTISDYYNNKVQRYDSYILAKICDALGCDIDEIVEYKKK